MNPQTRTAGTVLVACPQCHSIVRVPETRADERPQCPRCKAQVLTGEQPELAARLGIRSIPTLILFRDGRELARQSGALDAASLSRWLERALS